MPMKRYIFTRFPKYTGIGKYVHDLLEIKGIDTFIYSISFRNDVNSEDYYGNLLEPAIKIPKTTGWFINTRFQRILFRNLKKHISNGKDTEENIFHYSDYGIVPVTEKYRSVLTIHDLFQVSGNYNKYGYKSQSFLKKNIKEYFEFPHLLAVSNHVANEAVEFGFEHLPKVIYPPVADYLKSGLDKLQCRKKYSLAIDKKLVLSVSTDDPRKNMKTVKKTLDLLGSDYKLVRVGSKLDGAYNFRNLTNISLNEIYNACDVLLFPTLDEGFGYPLIEAMATGLPFVASNIEVVKEVCGKAGILVDPTPENCTLAVKEAISQRDEQIERGYERVHVYSFEKFADNVFSFYKDVVKS